MNVCVQKLMTGWTENKEKMGESNARRHQQKGEKPMWVYGTSTGECKSLS